MVNGNGITLDRLSSRLSKWEELGDGENGRMGDWENTNYLYLSIFVLNFFLFDLVKFPYFRQLISLNLLEK